MRDIGETFTLTQVIVFRETLAYVSGSNIDDGKTTTCSRYRSFDLESVNNDDDILFLKKEEF